MVGLIFSFLWDFPMIGLISSSSHSRVKTMILCRSWTQWFFLCPQSCWTTLRIFLVTNQKYMQCFDVRWHACILTWFWNIDPPSSMFHHHKVLLFAIQSFFYSFNVLAHSCASLPLRFKSSAHLGLGCPRWLLLLLFIKLDPAPKYGVALCRITSHSSPGFSR
jgi:hypothetical protein